jgi:DNA-binding NarL/FixJ family response regulator
MNETARQRIVIVDDDVWVRRGRTASLSEVPGFDVVASLSHPDAVEYPSWDGVDVAIVDAWDEREEFDRFPGVRVVEVIREHRDRSQTLVIIISGHVVDDVLRLRMAEAGADFFYSHSDVRDLRSLVDVIREPDIARRVTPGDPGRLAVLGLTPDSRPNATLREITESQMEQAFTPGAPQKSLPLSRRGIINARKRLAALARLSPDRQPGHTRSLNAPEWRAIVRFVNRARGVDDEEGSDEPR